MDGAIFVWWLVLLGSSNSTMAPMPVPFPTEAACHQAITDSAKPNQGHMCIPQAAADLAEFASLTAIDPTNWGVPE